MYRNALKILINWIGDQGRKPMIIRGARQVGKSTLVRNFSKALGRPLVEVNLERHRRLEEDFASLDVSRILNAIEVLPGIGALPADGILFLDEIQATPSALAALRYLHEERPHLPVLAAGSLLEFVLADHSFSMPVGRVSYLHLGPMNFEEFLLAMGAVELAKVLVNFTVDHPPSKMEHQRLKEEFLIYSLVGGMPASVLEYSLSRQMLKCRDIQQGIIDTYRDDFSKYGLKQDLLRLQLVMDRAALYLGKKVKFSELLPDEQSRTVKRLLDLLIYARLFTRIHHTAGNGLPLSAELSPKVFKLTFVDVGLLNAIRQVPLQNTLHQKIELLSIHRGSVAEQLVGQEMIAAPPISFRPELFYWLREGKVSNAEVDYLIAINGTVVPVEAKTGDRGRLQSLQIFCEQHQVKNAVRIGEFEISRELFQLKNKPKGDGQTIWLTSLPLYGAGQIARVLMPNECLY